ncbi:MAG: hypothetical protein IKJ06_05910 [Clostridia bacterium]|nr:hypothetical protein [Clostridia bacterium]
MREKDFSIAEIFKMIWNYKFMILGVVLALTLFVGIKTIFYTPDTFTANGSIYVSNQGTTTDDNPNSSIIVGDIVTSRILSETYIETLRTRSFMMDVSKSLNGSFTWSEIQSMTKIQSVNETELLSFQVTASTPQDAFVIASAIAERAPTKLSNIFKGGHAYVVDEPIKPIRPNDNGLATNLVFAIFFGLLIGVFFAFLLSILDKKVHSAEDVAKRYNVSILGKIIE